MDTGKDIRVFTLDEAARILRISKATLRRAEQAGQLRLLRFGRAVRVSAADIERLLNQRASDGDEESNQGVRT